MRKRILAYIFVALGLVGPCLTVAQEKQGGTTSATVPQEKKPLTNADVVSMVKAGLAESTVVLAIEKNPCKFDTSPAALVELKNQGVPPTVIEAMLRTEEPTRAPSPQPSAAQGQAAESKTEGVELLAEGAYYKGPRGWVRLEQAPMAGAGATKVGKMFVPGLTPQMVFTFRGAEAPVQIADPRPTIYVRQSPYMANVAGHSERDIIIVRFDKKKDHRELQTTSGGSMFTFKAGFSKEKTPEVVVNHVSETIFSVTPKSDLPPGEYLLTFGLFGMGGFDFGVTRGK
jgi:hypothetical protein